MPARRNAERRTSTNKQPSTASSSSPLSLQKQKTPPSHTSTSLGGANCQFGPVVRKSNTQPGKICRVALSGGGGGLRSATDLNFSVEQCVPISFQQIRGNQN